MQLQQKTELRKLMVPQLRHSLQILALPHLELKAEIQKELDDNPFLEESLPQPPSSYQRDKLQYSSSSARGPAFSQEDLDFRINSIVSKTSLQDVLLRQLGMFVESEQMYLIGQEIIGNLDENGYLAVSVGEIAQTLNIGTDKVEQVLKIIQAFDPPGVAARTLSECLLIQLEIAQENDPLLRKIVEFHLEDIARKNYSRIAKNFKTSLREIDARVEKILKLNPKPGRNYAYEELQQVVPDVMIADNDEDGLNVTMDKDDTSRLGISKSYRQMLKDSSVDPHTKEFLSEKLQAALNLLRAVSKRQETLRRIVEAVVEIQKDAVKNDFTHLKPLTFKEVAQKLDMHESTVCRAVMNKYVRLPTMDVVALRNFFSSHVHGQDGHEVSSRSIKMLIKKLIELEDSRHPLSDQVIARAISHENKITVSRRTVAKYRQELKILSSGFRRPK